MAYTQFYEHTYKPCLYQGKLDGIPVYLLRQVDDFVVAEPSEQLPNRVFFILQAGLKEPLKLLGLLRIYNHLDISHNNIFVKVSC